MSTEVQVEGPFWILSLREKLRAAGGIGIMRLHNILFYAAKEELAHRILLGAKRRQMPCPFHTTRMFLPATGSRRTELPQPPI